MSIEELLRLPAEKRDVMCAEKVFGLTVAYINGNARSDGRWDYDNQMGWIPGYSTDPADDYKVLKRVRETWDTPRHHAFLTALGWVRRDRPYDFSLRPLFYEPGDYTLAALAVATRDPA